MRNYPEVPRRVVTDTYFGVTVEDPYRYMEDKDAPEVKAIVAAENAYTKAFFDSQPKFERGEEGAGASEQAPYPDADGRAGVQRSLLRRARGGGRSAGDRLRGRAVCGCWA